MPRLRGHSKSRRHERRPILCLSVLLATLRHATAGPFLPGESTTSKLTSVQGSARARCPASYKCSNFPWSHTPFIISSARYNPATGLLCYQIAANRGCSKCSYACRAARGLGALYQLASDMGVQGTLSSTSVRPPSGIRVRVSPPTCLAKVGIASRVGVQRPKSGTYSHVLMRKGMGPGSMCIQYPKGMPFRRIGSVKGPNVPAPQRQVCCAASQAYKSMSATLQVWARGLGPKRGSGAGCQGCTNTPVSIATGTITGTVWQDSDSNDRYTVGVDEGFEGATVNLWRLSGTKRTFMGCTQSNSKGVYKFTNVVVDTYQVQVVKADTGPRTLMRFSRQSNSSNGSNLIQGSGMTPTFKLTGGTVTINALVQILPIGGDKRRRLSL